MHSVTVPGDFISFSGRPMKSNWRVLDVFKFCTNI